MDIELTFAFHRRYNIIEKQLKADEKALRRNLPLVTKIRVGNV